MDNKPQINIITCKMFKDKIINFELVTYVKDEFGLSNIVSKLIIDNGYTTHTLHDDGFILYTICLDVNFDIRNIRQEQWDVKIPNTLKQRYLFEMRNTKIKKLINGRRN